MQDGREKLRVLIVEDSEDDAQLLVSDLKQGGYRLEWRRVDTRADLNAALDAGSWDIVFADHSMPHYSGVLALTDVRARGLDVPFIFVSGSIGEDTAVAAMKAGANDYVMKGNVKRLLPAVERELREARLRREQRRTEQELRLLETATRAAADAADVLSALTATLSNVCSATDWVVAQAWLPRADGAVLECSAAWFSRDVPVENFRTASLATTFRPDEGMLGRVWRTRQPLWIAEIGADPDYARAAPARAAGLTSALAIPLLAGESVFAVLEFLSCTRRDPDERTIQLMTTVLGQLSTIVQRKRAEERMHYLAHFDALTGLPNRVLFADRLAQAMVEAERHGRLVGVAFLDIDRFKTINDSLGHGIGDLLLQAVAARLEQCVREGDTVARLAGDEFTLVLADMAQLDDASHVARKVLDSLAQPFHIGGHELFISASLGMTLCPSDDVAVEGLLRNADIAMYRAKDQGGNSYQFYSADMTAKARERLTLETAMRRALEREEFVLHYQPIISLPEHTAISLEALIRWNHPERGLVPPSEFVPLAEETGVIIPLGEWALRTAIRDSLYFASAGFPWLRVAVNMSAHQFRHPEIARMLKRMLIAAGSPAARLQVEITESVLMQNLTTSVRALHELSEMGVELSLDDFGTGYSSLSYLKRFPIDVLKIDRSFVRDIPGDADDAAIATAIISMAHSLGIEVIAEGVETVEQLRFLIGRDCDNVQGYYFSTPVPLSEVTGKLNVRYMLPAH
jgi:diguanylate cyclase (GGDEF)-like protein